LTEARAEIERLEAEVIAEHELNRNAVAEVERLTTPATRDDAQHAWLYGRAPYAKADDVLHDGEAFRDGWDARSGEVERLRAEVEFLQKEVQRARAALMDPVYVAHKDYVLAQRRENERLRAELRTCQETLTACLEVE